MLSSFRGRDEKEKCAAMFATAPPWLIWFTYGDVTATMLGIPSPDLLEREAVCANRKRRSRVGHSYRMERLNVARGLMAMNRGLPPAERERVRKEILQLDDQMTPRERQRALDIYLKYGDGRGS